MIAAKTAAGETGMAKKKLKIKFGSHRIEAVPESQSCEYERKLPLIEEWDQRTTVVSGGSQSEMRNSHGSFNSKQPKRGAMEAIEGPKEKRRKMDRGVTHQCSTLLKSLMTHPAGWVFNTPVDPVRLNIPDYFSIISKPMDLGTIKTKLGKSMYSEIEEFVADVRLTFSNAMLYNPPDNGVHQMAVELNNLFDSKWKFLEEKLLCDNPKVGVGKILCGRMMEVNDARDTCPRTPPLHNLSTSKKSKKSEEKIIKGSTYAKVAEVELPKPAQSCNRKLVVKNLSKGTDGGKRTCIIVNVKPPGSPVACNKCSKCSNTSSSCQCNLPSDSINATSSDITSERSLCGDPRPCSADDSKLDCQAKSTLTSQMSKSDPDSDGAVSALDDGNMCPSSRLTPLATDSASVEGWNAPLDVQMSPSKALRAAMLKRRFADTILKAQQRTLLDHGDKVDPMKLQQEKERLEKRQQEEKARIEAQLKAAEAASRMKAEKELKLQREKEREAARTALQKMERTVEIGQNLEFMKELESLSGCCLSPQLSSPLERIGLFMKRDYLVLEDEEVVLNLNADGEEGEISP